MVQQPTHGAHRVALGAELAAGGAGRGRVTALEIRPLNAILPGRPLYHFRVVGADFVTLDSGTGLVHQAPAFGEVDYEVLPAVVDPLAAMDPDAPEVCLGAPVREDGRLTFRDPDPETEALGCLY